jgi:H+/Cl- antiporter ClcA
MQLNRRNRLFLLSARVWLVRMTFWLGAVAVGLAASLFAIGADKSQAVFNHLLGYSRWLPLLLTPLTMASVVWITRRYFSGAEGSGIPQVIAMLKLPDTGVRRRVLSLRLALGKMGLTWLALCGGASVGREGPTVQIGAAILYSIGRWIRLPRQLSEHSLIIAGGAAGVAAAFNTPLAGIVFAIEEMARSFEEKTSGTLLTAVIVAGLAAMAVLGNYNYFGHTGAALPASTASWGLVFVAGVLGGIAGGIFSRILLHVNTHGLPGVIGRMMRSHPVGFAALCGLVLALLGLASGNHVFGSGYPEARHLIEAKAELPAEYGVLKLLATLVSFLSGIPGGLFAPSLSVGAGLGANLAPLFPGLDVSAVIVIGMVAYFAAVVQAPITAFVIVMEMIDNQDMMVPLMAAALIASTVSRLICRTPLYKGLALNFARKISAPTATASAPL